MWAAGKMRAAGAAVCCFAMGSVSASASALTGFNLVVGGNLSSNSEVDGRTLVGGNVSGTSNYGTKLTPSSVYSNIDSLIVGGNLGPGNLQIQAGDVRVGGTSGATVNLNGVGSQLFTNAAVAGTVATTLADMSALSLYLSSMPANSTISNPPGPSAVTFNAVSGPGNVTVFSVDGSIFSDGNSQQYQLNPGSGVNSATTFIFNVTGTSVSFNQGNFVGNFTSPSVRPYLIWNFADATAINLTNNWFGSIVAPKANLSNSTAIEGSVFVGGNFTQRGEVHLPNYNGVVPGSAVPEPSSMVLTSAALLMSAVYLRKRTRFRKLQR